MNKAVDDGNARDIDYMAERKRSGFRMQKGMAEHLRNGTTSRAEKPMINPPSVYTDPERFEQEKQKIFLEMPLFAGLTEDIPEPGNKLLFEAAGPSIVAGPGNAQPPTVGQRSARTKSTRGV